MSSEVPSVDSWNRERSIADLQEFIARRFAALGMPL